MRCALIIPSWTPEEIFPSKTAISQLNYWQPLGTLHVAAALEEAGHEVTFINGAFHLTDVIVDKVRNFTPDFIGIYSTTFGWPRAKETAGLLRRELPDSFIAVGGPFPIAMQEQCLAEEGAIDAVVTGEGEVTVVELLERLQDRKNLAGLEGVVYRDGETVVKNPPRPFITDLDALPFPARHLLGDRNLYLPPPATFKRTPVAVLMTSRGCNRKCLYCFQIDKERKSGIRFRSVENVLEEIEHLLASGYREIKFIDDTLAADYDRAMRLALEIKRRGLDFTWFASACVNQVDAPLLKAFREAGCWAILMGAESGVQKNLNTLRKGTTLAQIKKAVKTAKEAGLTVFTPFLFGIPGETYEEALETIRFACELDPHVANFHAITPFPGTELYDRIAEFGRMDENLQNFTYQGAAFIPHTMTREQILNLRQLAFRKFYSRPKFLCHRLFSIRNAADLRASYRGMISLAWLWMSRDLFHRRPLDHSPVVQR